MRCVAALQGTRTCSRAEKHIIILIQRIFVKFAKHNIFNHLERMANRFTSIKLHLVFAFKEHESYIPEHHLSLLFSYIAASINSRKHHAIEVGGRPDHIHILFDYNPTEPLPDLIRDLKTAATRFIDEHYISPSKIQWQRGYGCFSVSCHDYEKTRRYIQNQKEHHTQTTVREELKNMLSIAGVPFSDEYLFE